MAEINGTNAPENLAGTSADDVIFGFGGADFINGAGGNDTIDGGALVDDILGGDGDDTITGGLGADIIDAGAGNDTIIASAAEIAGDTINGGDGDDTLVTSLAVGAVIDNTGSASSLSATGATPFSTANLEFLKVTNASDFLLDLGSDAAFGLDANAIATGTAAGVAQLEVLGYTAIGGTVAANTSTDLTAGVIIGGVTYATGATFATSDGGIVTVGAPGTNFTLSYAANVLDTYAVGDGAAGSSDDIIGDSVVATVTLADGSTVDVAVDFALNLTSTFTAAAATAGINSSGDSQDNTMTGSDFGDVIWAGAALSGNDTLSGGKGDDVLGAGDGVDTLNGDAGNDTLFAGSGVDTANGGDGDDKIFGGADADTLNGDAGNDTIYGGSDVAIDTINGGADDDIIFGGAGDDTLNGDAGNDLIYNGAGVDAVNGGAGDDVLWGGAGNDTLTGGFGNDTFSFISGNGLDVVADWEFGAYTTASDIGDVLDLSAFGFTDAQDVINSMTDVAAGVQLVLAAGTVVTLDNVAGSLSVNDFQIEAITDWVLV